MVQLIFLGPPGSGKGTYASRIAVKYGIPTLSTGEMLRQAVKSGSPIGAELKVIMESGKLVSDEVVGKVLIERLTQPDCLKGFILDGFPRTIAQADTLGKVLESRGVKLTRAINVVVTEELVQKRLGGRRSCGKCGEIYNIFSLPPKAEGICDKDGEKLVIRQDDQPETIKKRFEVYREQSEPLIAYYTKRGLVSDVDGSLLVDDVVAKIAAAIDKETQS